MSLDKVWIKISPQNMYQRHQTRLMVQTGITYNSDKTWCGTSLALIHSALCKIWKYLHKEFEGVGLGLGLG